MRYTNKKDTFFELPNPINSYWAGFIAADGYLNESKNTLQISLSVKDQEHLEIIKQELNPNFIIKHHRHICSLNDKEVISCRFSVVSNKIIQDLKKNWGLHQAKTFSLQFPSYLDFDNKRSFLSGYLDGDGSINIIKGKRNKIQLSICGNHEFLLGMVSFIREEGKIKLPNNIYQTKGIYTFATNGKPAIQVLEFLYQKELPLMKRKWNFYLDNRQRCFGQYLEWTEQETLILKSSYNSMSSTQIHKSFFPNRSFESVEKKISNLKLRKPGRKNQISWSEQENTIFLKAIQEGLTTNEIHDKMFPYRTFYSVRNQRRKLFHREIKE
jgi:hypothetical protein